MQPETGGGSGERYPRQISSPDRGTCELPEPFRASDEPTFSARSYQRRAIAMSAALSWKPSVLSTFGSNVPASLNAARPSPASAARSSKSLADERSPDLMKSSARRSIEAISSRSSCRVTKSGVVRIGADAGARVAERTARPPVSHQIFGSLQLIFFCKFKSRHKSAICGDAASKSARLQATGGVAALAVVGKRESDWMPNTRKILVVDDDSVFRDALTEQLGLHEEFEALTAENGSKGVQAAKEG